MNKINWSTVDNFTENEFKCKCCGICNVNINFLCQLEEARRIAGIPFIITSGCRCKKHNKEVGGVENSRHISTKHLASSAADIATTTDRRRMVIVRALIEAGFTSIGLSKKDYFVHVDDDQRLKMWLY